MLKVIDQKRKKKEELSNEYYKDAADTLIRKSDLNGDGKISF